MSSVTRIAVAYFVAKYRQSTPRSETLAKCFCECWHLIFRAIETASDTKCGNKDSLTFTIAEELIMPYLQSFPQIKPQITALREAWRRGAELCREKLDTIGEDDRQAESVDETLLQQALLDVVSEMVGTRHPLVPLLAYRNNFFRLLTNLVAQQAGIKQQSHPQNADNTAVAARTAASSPFLQIGPGSVIDHYLIVGKIGVGGMGVVYKADDRKLKRQVAIKFIMGGGQGMLHKRFVREMEVSAHLNHPNIITVYGVGNYQQLPYMVMEYIDGYSLLEYIVEQKIDRYRQLAILEKVARALAYAHKKNVIHRDVKPSNIMVRHDGEPILMDFGIAKVTEVSDRSLTRSGEIIGTLQYMSPEQAQGLKKEIGPATDVYALGAMLYQLLTGKSLVDGTTIEKIHQIIHKKPQPPRSLCPDIPVSLEKICLRALEKKAQRRHPSCKHFAADLRSFIDGKQTKCDQFYRRQKLRFSVIIALILVLSVMAGWGLWQGWSHWQFHRTIVNLDRQLVLINRTFTRNSEQAARQLALIAIEIQNIRCQKSADPSPPKIAKLQSRLQQTLQMVNRHLAIIRARRAYQKAQQHIVRNEWLDADLELKHGQLVLTEAKICRETADLLGKIEVALQRVAFFQENYQTAYSLGKKWKQALDGQGRWMLAYSAYRCHLYREAQQYFRPIAQNGSPDQRSKALYYQGRMALAARRYRDACSLFAQGIERSQQLPEQFVADLRLYYCCAALADIDCQLTIGELTKLGQLLAQIKPSDSTADLYRRTQARFWLKQAEQPNSTRADRERLRQAASIFTDSLQDRHQRTAEMYYLRGKVQALLQNIAAARKDFTEAFALNPAFIGPLLAKVQLLRTEMTPWDMALSELEYNRLLMQGLQVNIDLFAPNFDELRRRCLQQNLSKSGCPFSEKQFCFYYEKLKSATPQVIAVARTAIASMTPSDKVITRLRQDAGQINRKIINELLILAEEQRQQQEYSHFIVRLLDVPAHGKITRMDNFSSPENQKCLEKIVADGQESLLLRFLAARILTHIAIPEQQRQICHRYVHANAAGQNPDWVTMVLMARALQEIDYHYFLLDASFLPRLAGWTIQSRESFDRLSVGERDFLLACIAHLLNPSQVDALPVLRWIMKSAGDQARVVAASSFVNFAKCPCPEVIVATLQRGLQSQITQVRAYSLQVLAQLFSSNVRVWTQIVHRYCPKLPSAIYRMVTPPATPAIQLQRAALNFWCASLLFWRSQLVLSDDQYQKTIAAIRQLWQHSDPLLRCQAIMTSGQIFDRIVFEQVGMNSDRTMLERMAAMLGMLVCQNQQQLSLWMASRMPQLLSDPSWQGRGFLTYTFSRFMSDHLGRLGKSSLVQMTKRYFRQYILRALADSEPFVQMTAMLGCYFLDLFGLIGNKHLQRLRQMMNDSSSPLYIQTTALATLLNLAYRQQTFSLTSLHVRAMKLSGQQRYIAAYGYVQPIEHVLFISTGTVRKLQSKKASLWRYRIHWSLKISKKKRLDWRQRITKLLELLADQGDIEVYQDYSYILALLYLKDKDYRQAFVRVQTIVDKSPGCPPAHHAALWLKLAISRQDLPAITSYFGRLQRQLTKATETNNVSAQRQLQILLARSLFIVYCADSNYHQAEQRALYSSYVDLPIPLPEGNQSQADFLGRLHNLLVRVLGVPGDKAPATIAKSVQAQYLYDPQSPAGLLSLGKLCFTQKRYRQAQTIFHYVGNLLKQDDEARYWNKLSTTRLGK